MEVIEAQMLPVLAPHDHRHINQMSAPGWGHVGESGAWHWHSPAAMTGRANAQCVCTIQYLAGGAVELVIAPKQVGEFDHTTPFARCFPDNREAVTAPKSTVHFDDAELPTHCNGLVFISCDFAKY